MRIRADTRLISAFAAMTCLAATPGALADVVHNDDVIILGSQCVGLDCVNGEGFGFDTVKLKENNLRIHFQDTSNSASFPKRDWRIVVNDFNNGGQERFSIEDVDANRTPFTIEANPPSHSLYVDDIGRVGLGTSNPAMELHIPDGNTPTIRLEQNTNQGFGAQKWDVAGNETGFFVRDVTGGSNVPFKIFPGAPTKSLAVGGTGSIGMGINFPQATLHVKRNNGTASALIEEAKAAKDKRELLVLRNTGSSQLVFDDTRFANNWIVNDNVASFEIFREAKYSERLELENTGNMTIGGALTENSDRNAKQGIEPVNPDQILEKVAALPVAHWQYTDNPDVDHIGPMAQDFHAAFGLGASETGISTLDTSGVALAAIQALNTRLLEQNDAIKESNTRLRAQNLSLEQRVSELEVDRRRLAELEAMVINLVTERADRTAQN